ncbi:ADP-ribosylglycohydrolase family protein [Serinibacter arcticus]|uniref:ADP-ribosylglycohydrolase family protein n=1 Tax=Serinibacter arcticus TaxID=1655435 RepID=UPI0013052BC5|nr:ADP-ribosylglycohydrolase family protein [Serinibacter arcticus]
MSSERADGVLVALAVGDALGWPQEDRSQIVGGRAAREVEPAPTFRPWQRYGGTRFANYIDHVDAGTYSDDTQLALAVGRACLRGSDWWAWLTEVELPQWPIYQRGGGGAVLRASRAWAAGRPPWQIGTTAREHAQAESYFKAGGNGVAMRIAPHVLVAVSEGISWGHLARRVISDGLTTHAHPHAILGAVLHARALSRTLTTTGTLEYGTLLEDLLGDRTWTDFDVMHESADRLPAGWHHAADTLPTPHPRDEWNRAVRESLDSLTVADAALQRGPAADDRKTLEAIGCFDRSRSGAGTVAAIAAVYVASRSAVQPTSGLLRTAFLNGADTDTIASMTASLLGALHGTRWLGVLGQQVQDATYISNLARQLTRPLSRAEPAHGRISDSAMRRWTKDLHHLLIDRMPDGRRAEIVQITPLAAKNGAGGARVQLRSIDGQTFYVDKVSRSSSRADLEFEASPAFRSAQRGRRSNEPAMEFSDQPIRQPSAIVHVETRVANLHRSANFYEDLLGLRVGRSEGHFVLENGLRFVQFRSTATGGAPTRGLLVTIAHPDLDGLVRRARDHGNDAVWSERGDSLWLKDPDGNVVRVTTMPTDLRVDRLNP